MSPCLSVDGGASETLEGGGEGSGGFSWVLWAWGAWEEWREERTGKDKEGEEGFIGFSCGEETLGASLWLLAPLWIFFLLDVASIYWRFSKRKGSCYDTNEKIPYFSIMYNW